MHGFRHNDSDSPHPKEVALAGRPGMNVARQFVVVRAPIDRVYERWSRVGDLPKFITPLPNVRRIDNGHFSYVWHPNGNDLGIAARVVRTLHYGDGVMFALPHHCP
jgi:uncharacterized membrane protein